MSEFKPNGYFVDKTGKRVEICDAKAREGVKALSDPGKPHMQLVSDKDGKAVWEEALAYKEVKQITFADNMTFDTTEDDDGDGVPDIGYSMKPWPGTFKVGKTYTVSYGGHAWDCPAVAMPAEMPVDGVLLGNTAQMGDNIPQSNPDAPFLMMALNTPMNGAYCVFSAPELPDAITVTGETEETKKIGPEYLPDTTKYITLTIDADGNVTSDTSFGVAVAMDNAQLQAAIKVVETGTYGGQPSTLESDVQVRRRTTAAMGEMLEIAFRQFADPGDYAVAKEITRYIYWAGTGIRLENFRLYSLPVMDAGWGNVGTYYLRCANSVWEPVTIDQLKADLGLT